MQAPDPVIFYLLESFLKLGLSVLAVATAAFFSHLLDPEPMPRFGRWSRRPDRQTEIWPG